MHKHGIDFNEVYGPFMEIVRIRVALKAYKGWEIHQLDLNLEFF